jgi:hypothetical protein
VYHNPTPTAASTPGPPRDRSPQPRSEGSASRGTGLPGKVTDYRISSLARAHRDHGAAMVWDGLGERPSPSELLPAPPGGSLGANRPFTDWARKLGASVRAKRVPRDQ